MIGRVPANPAVRLLCHTGSYPAAAGERRGRETRGDRNGEKDQVHAKRPEKP